MAEKAEIINLNASPEDAGKKRRIALDSGRQVLVHSDNKTEIVEVIEPKGDMIIKVALTDAGPVIRIHGAHLEVKSTKSLSLESETVKIKAKEKAIVESGAGLDIKASGDITVRADDDVRITGRKIHLN